MNEKELRELIGEEPKPAPAPIDRFRPWHRPRKQFIRTEQWSLMLRTLLVKLKDRGHTGTVKYLGLPGEDLLDVRMFHDLVAEVGADWYLRFLGFNGVASSEEVLAESIIHDLPRVRSDLSRLLRHPLESVANANGPGGKALREFGGFDIVNVDLCDAIRPPGGTGVLDALRAIVQHQLTNRIEPWLLFLTTRVDPASLDRAAHASFIERLAANASSSGVFAELVNTEMTLTPEHLVELLRVLRSGEGEVPSTQPPTVGLGIAKWLLGLLNTHPCGLAMGPCYMYGIGSAEPDMAALAFRFDRHPAVVTDPSGLTKTAPATPAPLTEEETACKLVKPIARMRNIDLALRDDAALKQRYLEASADLLGRAGHDREAYLRWAAGFAS